MGKAAVLSQAPECTRKIGPAEQLFLDEIMPVDEQPEKFQKILENIWDIVSVFYPFDRTGDTILEIPSNRLIELGFVSSETRARIRKRELRKKKNNQRAADVGKNVVVIANAESGFYLTENYVTEEEFFGNGIRRDCIVRDRIHLSIKEEKFVISIEREMTKYHIHALNAIWHFQNGVAKPREVVEVTAKRVNILLALLLEGVAPGCLNDRP